MSDYHTNSRKRQIRTTSNEGTDNPRDRQFPRGLPESNTNGRSAYSTHHPLINAYIYIYIYIAAAVLKGEDNCDSSAIFQPFVAEQITEEEASKNYKNLRKQKNSAKVQKWRKKHKLVIQNEDKATGKARQENLHLKNVMQQLTQRLCDLNTIIAEIQQKEQVIILNR